VALSSLSPRSQGDSAGQFLFTDGAWHEIAWALEIAPRELEIVRQIFDDRTEADIARELGISPHTVHTYVERIFHKLNVTSRVQLVVRVVEQQNTLATAPIADSSRLRIAPRPASIAPGSVPILARKNGD